MSNKTYDLLKKISQLVLPALGALYFAIAQLWNLPLAEEIVGTITAIDAFLGAVLGISNHNYKKQEYELNANCLPLDDLNEPVEHEVE